MTVINDCDLSARVSSSWMQLGFLSSSTSMKLFLALVVLLSSGCAWIQSLTVHPIAVGQIEFDPPTTQSIGLSLPVLAGDENFNASVRVFYRQMGLTTWNEALPLQRVRKETISRTVPSSFPIAEQFAGSIFNVQAGATYEVSLTIEDPEGATTTRTGRVSARPIPSDKPPAAREISVDSDGALAAALSHAMAGDVITIAEGRYRGPFHLQQSGTAPDPIVVKGTDRQRTVIESPGAEYGVLITGSHVYLEDVTITSSKWGMKIANVNDAVVRGIHIHHVQYGINAREGTNTGLYICDNLLEGNGVAWPDTSGRTWNYEGIVVTGAGHVICDNTLAGFGDALGLSEPGAIPNRAIDFYGNDVLWGGDDGIELDFGERNIRAFENRFGNVAMGMSFQPIWGGPVYAFRNVMYNTAVAPYKLNQNPSGFHIFHNTSIRPGWAWLQYGEHIANFSVINNLIIGTDKAVYMTPFIEFGVIDYNGWSPDGEFKFDYSWDGFSSLQSKSPYERHGRILKGPVFLEQMAVPSQFASFMSPPRSVMLHSESNAVDAAVRLPNMNDDYTGEAPDLGALERSHEPPHYGVHWRVREGGAPVTN
jgi:hypothetical protein